MDRYVNTIIFAFRIVFILSGYCAEWLFRPIFSPKVGILSSKAPGRIVNEFGQTSGCPGEAIQPGHLFKILFQNESFLWTWTPQFRNHGLPICDRLWPKHMVYWWYRRWRWNWLPVKPESFFWAVLNNCRTPNRMSETLCQKRDTFRH